MNNLTESNPQVARERKLKKHKKVPKRSKILLPLALLPFLILQGCSNSHPRKKEFNVLSHRNHSLHEDDSYQSWDIEAIPTESSPGPLPVLGLFSFFAGYMKLRNRR